MHIQRIIRAVHACNNVVAGSTSFDFCYIYGCWFMHNTYLPLFLTTTFVYNANDLECLALPAGCNCQMLTIRYVVHFTQIYCIGHLCGMQIPSFTTSLSSVDSTGEQSIQPTLICTSSVQTSSWKCWSTVVNLIPMRPLMLAYNSAMLSWRDGCGKVAPKL